MNIAVILAGGKGVRLDEKIPKQYLEVRGKPVIVYTLEKFEASPTIDAIEVVCASQYIDHVKKLAEKYGIKKLRWVSEGGHTCQASIRNGVFALHKEAKPDDIIMLHMSVSPMIAEETIEKAVETCLQKGNAFAVQPCLFCMCKKVNDEWSDQNAYKEEYLQLNMPWTMKFGELYTLYQKMTEQDVGMDVKDYLPSLMYAYGKKTYFFPDNDKNRLKITTKGDLELFEAYLIMDEQKTVGK